MAVGGGVAWAEQSRAEEPAEMDGMKECEKDKPGKESFKSTD